MIKKLIKWVIIFAVIAFVCVFGVNKFLRHYFPMDFEEIIAKYSAEYGVPQDKIAAVIKAESGFRPQVVSSAGAIGLMQLTPETFKWLQTKTEEKEDYTDEDLKNPEINIKYGTLNLKMLAGSYENEKTQYAAYNAGRGRVNEWLKNPEYSKDGKSLIKIPYKETRNYANKMEFYRKIYRYIY